MLTGTNSSSRRPLVRKGSATKAFIANETRRTVLAAEGTVLRSMWRMALGAMFRGLRGRALVFVWYRSERIAITNVFVPESIDILWLDERLRVVDLHTDFRPWSLHAANTTPARYVVELPAGVVHSSGTARGDRIRIEGIHPKPF